MKNPVIIWQKPEYKKFGRVKVAVLVSPTLILDHKETPEIKNFDHHRTPILCSNRGLGFAPSKRIKSVITPHVGMDYHPMTEQEAWRFVNNELLKA